MRRVFLAFSVLFLSACPEEPKLTREELLKPETCMSCHPDHYREWSGSMHAYATDDPLFLAMNAIGQHETNGELGDFCVGCHAPMAVLEGATTDGLNLDQVPQHLKGVTCFFCHTVEAVEGQHNNPLRLADDLVMRGGLRNPKGNSAHKAAYSPLHDRNEFASSDLCGSCHDIVTPAGVHLERTFLEWKESVFGKDIPGQHLSCSECHMTGRDGVAADYEGVPFRRVHEHTFAGVDTASTPWPEMEAQLAAIRRDLDPSVQGRLCVTPFMAGVQIDATLDNVLVGHMWPSGAAQDRRAWVELVAYQGDTVIWQSGVVADDEPVAKLADPNLWLLRDKMFDDNDNEVHMFWEARRVETNLLPPAVTNDPTDPRFFHAVTTTYELPTLVPDRVTMRARIRAFGLDAFDEVKARCDATPGCELDPAVRSRIPTFDLEGTVLEWSGAPGTCVPR